MGFLFSVLPKAEGLLPLWILLIATTSIGNSIQCYSTLYFTARVYNPTALDPPLTTPAQVTELSSRLFGTWTLLTSLVRLYGAYHINDPSFYHLVFLTFAIAWAHFASEWLVFKTTRWGLPLAFPVTISTVTMVWMGLQRKYYVIL